MKIVWTIANLIWNATFAMLVGIVVFAIYSTTTGEAAPIGLVDPSEVPAWIATGCAFGIGWTVSLTCGWSEVFCNFLIYSLLNSLNS